MKVLALEIFGFRGIPYAKFLLSPQQALIGSNGSGKSTLVDALNLVFGRQKLVRTLTEHDFTGSDPKPADRIRVIATLGGFSSDDSTRHSNWFRDKRSVPKWWDSKASLALPVHEPGRELCSQIAFAARFDRDELEVKTVRYFHDDDAQVDPFDEDNINRVPDRLLQEIGYFALPTRRTWASSISFASDLFRKAVATLGGIPSEAILDQVEALKRPREPLEEQEELKPLIDGINRRLAQLLPDAPRLQLRVTGTDSEAFLSALVPHYIQDGGDSLPAGRHGTGLISLQTLALLLEIGRARKEKGQSFILALEEPELHIPPGLQRRLIGDAVGLADQVITTTHSPRVVAFFEPSSIQTLYRVPACTGDNTSTEDGQGRVEGRTLIPESMVSAPNAVVQLFTESRTHVVEALMFRHVLIPEGRTDFEWIRLLVDLVETAPPEALDDSSVPPFSALVGLIPTRSAQVEKTFSRLVCLHHQVSCLVDGDAEGDRYVAELSALRTPPHIIFQWPPGWAMEDVIGWILGDSANILADINLRLVRSFKDSTEFLEALKEKSAKLDGLKEHYFAHEEITSCLKQSKTCVGRAALVLEAMTRALLGTPEDFAHLVQADRSTEPSVRVYRFEP